MEPSVQNPGSKAPDDSDSEALPTLDRLGLAPAPARSLADRISDGVARFDTAREQPVLVALAVSSLLVAAVAIPLLRRPPQVTPVEELVPQVTLTPTSAPDGRPAEVVVHVSGAVSDPGVYTVPASARVVDVLDAAGGPSGGADVHQLNLAAMVVDGQHIRVPRVGEILPSVSEPLDAGPIDINRAGVARLQELPGVGPATADAIVAFREEHGPFRTIDSLLDVPGIGPAKLAAIADAAVVR